MADEPRSRFTDDRLADTFVWITNELQRLGRQLNGLPAKTAEMDAELRAVREDTGECRQGVDRVEKALAQRAAERKQEREEARKEKRDDRRLWIATAVGVGGLVIAAIQVLSSGAHP